MSENFKNKMEMIAIQYLEHWTPWTILYREVVLYVLNTLFRGRKTRYFRRELCTCNIEKKKKVSKIFFRFVELIKQTGQCQGHLKVEV